MAEQAAREDGFNVDHVIVDDDVAVQDSTFTVGRRGVAGTVFVPKCAGAAAETGVDLPEVKRVAAGSYTHLDPLDRPPRGR